MNRRAFLLSTLTFFSIPPYLSRAYAQNKASLKKARVVKTQLKSAGQRYNNRRIKDPTGTAPTSTVERFELRGGDCFRGDCIARPNRRGILKARARTEKVLTTTLKDGDEGLFRYSVYFPSSEYSIVGEIGSTFGQLLSAIERPGVSDSFPIFSLDTASDDPNSTLEVVLEEARNEGLEKLKHSTVKLGSLHRYFNRWIGVSIRFRLSSKRDGFLSVSIDGKKVSQFTGRTIVSDGFLELRYGIYQTGTNRYPGGANAVPAQVAYFSNIGVFKIVT